MNHARAAPPRTAASMTRYPAAAPLCKVGFAVLPGSSELPPVACAAGSTYV